MKKIKVIDSHTGGEPTRIIIEGGPDLGDGPLSARRQRFAENFDDIRRAVVDEPRGNDVMIGGLLCESSRDDCVAGVIFFDTAGYLGMCGHGTIGFTVTLQHMGLIQPGTHKIETPVGVVTITLAADNRVTFQNIPAFRHRSNVPVEVDGVGRVTGDIAWGGNWFFLIKNLQEKLQPSNTDHLLWLTRSIRDALQKSGITGPDGEMIDHIELYGPPTLPDCDSKNFVLCPGGEYDRSPCGTGTSAKLACLAADNKLQPGEIWRQESIIGSVFECHYQWVDQMNRDQVDEANGVGGSQTAQQSAIVPTLSGWARVCGESTLILDPADPFCMGIPG